MTMKRNSLAMVVVVVDARFKDCFTKFLITTAIFVVYSRHHICIDNHGLDPCAIRIFKKLTFFMKCCFFFISLSRFGRKSSSRKNTSFKVFDSGNETSGTELSGSGYL